MASFVTFCLMIRMVVCLVPGETNLALNKPASQVSSSLGSLGQASNAVDGNTDGNFYAGSCSQTIENVGIHWWMVDLQGIYTIRSFRITNRNDCCPESLGWLTVEISSENPHLLAGFPGRTSAARCKYIEQSLPFGNPYPYNCDSFVTGRYVRIIKSHRNKYLDDLTICEFEVYENRMAEGEPPPSTPNVAFKKPTDQSSTYQPQHEDVGPESYRANDGTDEGSLMYGSCSMTDEGEVHWWMTDLTVSYTIGTIRITNRFDCCSDRLADFVVEVSEEDPSTLHGFPGRTNSPVCVTVMEPVPIPFPVNYDCDQPVTGRYVRIVKGGEPLALCEVRVYEADPNGRRITHAPEQPTTSSPEVKPIQNAQTLVFVHRINHGFQHTLSMTEQRYEVDCARQRLKDRKNMMAAPYIQVDLPAGTCRFLENITDGRKSTSPRWTVYELINYKGKD